MANSLESHDWTQIKEKLFWNHNSDVLVGFYGCTSLQDTGRYVIKSWYLVSSNHELSADFP